MKSGPVSEQVLTGNGLTDGSHCWCPDTSYILSPVLNECPESGHQFNNHFIQAPLIHPLPSSILSFYRQTVSSEGGREGHLDDDQQKVPAFPFPPPPPPPSQQTRPFPKMHFFFETLFPVKLCRQANCRISNTSQQEKSTPTNNKRAIVDQIKAK